MKYDPKTGITLESTGRVIDAASPATLSPVANDQLLYGHDGSIDFEPEYGAEPPLTQAERDEIANHMIDLWTQWKNRELPG